MFSVDKRQRLDINEALNNKLTHTVDEYNMLTSPFHLDLLTVEDKIVGKWIETDEGLKNYVIGQNEFLRFKIGCIAELRYKTIENIQFHLSYRIENEAGSVPCITSLGIGKDNTLSYVYPEYFMNEDQVVIDCETFGYNQDNLNSIIHTNGFEFEVMLDGNLSNARVILESAELVFSFRTAFDSEREVIENRIEDLLSPSLRKVIIDDKVYSVNYDGDTMILNSSAMDTSIVDVAIVDIAVVDKED